MELVGQIGSGMSRILKAYDRSVFELTPNFTAEGFIMSNDKIIGKINEKIKTVNFNNIFSRHIFSFDV